MINKVNSYNMSLGNRLVIYTPTYHKSTGLQYRLSMLIKTLKENGYEVYLHVDEHETLLRSLYARTAKHLLQYKYIWEVIGKHIANTVLKYNLDIAFLTIDTTAGAIPLLKSKGIKTVLLLEDLTVDWLQVTNKARERILKHLSEYASQADLVVVPGEQFREKVKKELGINPLVCPPGLELKTTLEEALSRPLDKVYILHARRIEHPMEAQLLELIAEQIPEDRYTIYALKAGKHHTRIRSRRIHWYYYLSLEEAVKHLKKHHVGLIATPRTAPTFTSYWFHLSLLQPTIMITSKPPEETENVIYVPIDEFWEKPLTVKEAIDKIISKYLDIVKNLHKTALALSRNNAHKELIKVLRQII